MSTNLVNGPIWNIVKASLPKGASDTEIWNKTDKVLKEHDMSWDSARKDQTTNGKAAPKQQIYDELLGKKSESKSTTETPKAPNAGTTPTNTNPVGTAPVPDWGTANPNNWGGYLTQLINQQASNNPDPYQQYTGFNSYLSGQGAQRNNSGQLAARTNGFIGNMTGRQFLPWYNDTQALNSLM